MGFNSRFKGLIKYALEFDFCVQAFLEKKTIEHTIAVNRGTVR